MLFRLGKSQRLTTLLALLAVLVVACRSTNSAPYGDQNANHIAVDKVKLQIEEDGVYRVSRQELANAGLDIEEKNIEEVRLSHRGQTVPIILDENSLIFYGEAPNGRYFDERSYILELGESGEEMRETILPEIEQPLISKISQTIHLEENHEYVSEARQSEHDDVWFWYKLSQQDTFSVEVDLKPIDTDSATIRINAWGFTYDREIEGDHSFDVLINDISLGEVVWDGQIFETAVIEVPPGVLQSGKNKIVLDNRPEGASFLDIMQINWIELDHFTSSEVIGDRFIFPAATGVTQINNFSDQPIVLDISTPSAPKQISNFEFEKGRLNLSVDQEIEFAAVGPQGFLTPQITKYRISDWRDEQHQADLIIVTTDELAPALEPLIAAREAQGLSVVSIPVEVIYDEFGYGEASPESIQRFITFAHENWQEPAPQYLFIVGDATNDFLGYVSDVPANTIPSMIIPVQFSGETVSDSRIVDINGDTKPDMAVGRWPVRTVEEVENLVNRTLAYEQGEASEKVIFTVDNSETRFNSIASELTKSSNLPQEQVTLLDGPSAGELTEELNDGSWLTAYIGHGSIGRWGKEGIFELDAVNNLASGTPPIVVQLTCLSGLFSHPQETSLSEAMLNHPNGPVLTVAATSLTLSGHQEPFARALLQKLQDPQIKRIGDAFKEAKLSLDVENSDGLREISDTFALFGDPSTMIVRPQMTDRS